MNAPHSLFLILNGKSAGRPDIRTAVHDVRDLGHRVAVRVTWEKGDAARFVGEAIGNGFDTVVAGGGDGTINEVVSGLLQNDHASAVLPSMGIMPLGTANDFAHSCGIPLDPLAALKLAATQAAKRVDVGRCNGRYFMNVATGGFGTQVTVSTSEDLKKALGGAAYLLTALTQFNSIRAAHGRLSGPRLSWEGDFLVLAVGNGRQAGGGHQLCPQALLNDGLLDVRVLPQLPAEEIPQTLRTLLHEGFDAVKRTLVDTRVASLQINADETMQINLDGEPISDTHFELEVLPGRLRLHLPENCPLVKV